MDPNVTVAVEDKLSLIQRMLHAGDYDIAVKESCTLFEIVFRRIFQQAVVSLPFADRNHIFEMERKIGKGNKGVQDFGFGELVGLFRESKLMEKWSKHTSRDLGLIQTLNYSEIVNLRNRITHSGATCSRGEANLVFEYLRNLLAVLGFADLEGSIHQSFKQENSREKENGESEEDNLLQRLPKIQKSSGVRSQYSPSYGNERTRLKVQGNNYRNVDMKAFEQAMKLMGGTEDLVALDLGCAGGYVTFDRFSGFPSFKSVVGIDVNPIKIEEAVASVQDERFSFYQMDIESSDFEERLQAILAERGKMHFDFIFSALTLHHLQNPLKALVKLRKLLKPGGCLLIRGSDDGSKTAYPDDQNLVDTIFWMTQQVEGAADRQNGRKIYNQLWKSGFRTIEMCYDVIDTAGKSTEERLSLFEGSFSHRINNFRKRLERYPDHPQFKQEHDWMREALDELEIEFLNDAFYYQETIYVGIGKK